MRNLETIPKYLFKFNNKVTRPVSLEQIFVNKPGDYIESMSIIKTISKFAIETTKTYYFLKESKYT